MPSPDESQTVASEEIAPAASGSGRLQRLRVIFAAIVLGAISGLSAVIVYYGRQSGPPLPELTVERFTEARAKWQAQPISDYDIRIEVKGNQPAVYEVQVRNGVAERALRNGRPLTQRRTWGTWSVDGMFATIGVDVDNLRRSAASSRDRDLGAMQLNLGAEFDPQHHYPSRYFRLEQVQFGNNRSVTWEVTKFQVQVEDSPMPGADNPGDAEDDSP